MNSFQLKVLLKVIDSGSFTRTGDQIGLTQSGVSHIITALENELGIALLRRARTGSSLTAEGQTVIAHMREIAGHMEQIEQKVAALNGLTIGRLSIGSFPSFSARYIPTLLALFKEQFPTIDVHLYEGGYEDIRKWVQDGTVDIGFTALPVHKVDFIPLLEDPLYVVIHKGHFFFGRGTVHVEDMTGQSFIMLRSGCETLIEEAFKQHGVSPSISYDIKDNQTVISMVSKNLGISIMPNLALPEESMDLCYASLEPQLVRNIGYITRKGKAPSPLALEFMSIIDHCFPDHERLLKDG
ncbi:LysR family transcriptional regulator [Rossellomorea marisflavi]|uniref:LysR family transcriptional regulator n=1 Tax=Rossellomorea marisflavi TaxID=189381 RepID=UPI0009A5873E|nr:LysR family transcriptional regulator [Rossellomorea marisflavi]